MGGVTAGGQWFAGVFYCKNSSSYSLLGSSCWQSTTPRLVDWPTWMYWIFFSPCFPLEGFFQLLTGLVQWATLAGELGITSPFCRVSLMTVLIHCNSLSFDYTDQWDSASLGGDADQVALDSEARVTPLRKQKKRLFNDLLAVKGILHTLLSVFGWLDPFWLSLPHYVVYSFFPFRFPSSFSCILDI